MNKKLIRTGLAVFLLALGAGIVFYFWLAHDLPSLSSLDARLTPPSIRITDRQGRLLYDVLPSESGRHTSVALADVPLACQQATIATEDRYFYHNPGVDVIGIVRAFWIDLAGGEVRAGGSTITQQVVRGLLFESDERNEISLRRKLREALLALRLTRQLGKEEILALYLNHTYYGGMAYGIEAAAQTFFGKAAKDLDTAECALIAGLPQAPALYNPFTDPEAAQKRQHVVLGLMAEQGYLNEADYALAAGEPLTFTATPYPIEAPHFVMMVRNQIDALFTPEEIYARGGLIVRTTLNIDWQHLAEHAVSTQVRKVKEAREGMGHNLNSAALVALNPTSGEILALVGSPDYFDAENGGAINMALAPRQPGSSIKPLVYAAAFDPMSAQPWTPATLILDVYTTFATRKGEPYTPKNYDGLEHGPVLARQALASSLNIPAVKALEHVTLPTLFELATKLGITTLNDPERFDLSLALGGGDVKLLELTAAYGAFANGGRRVGTYIIESVHDPAGNLCYQHESSAQPRVLDERVAWLISDILSDNSARRLGFGENSTLRLDRPAAVKTGTTTNWHDNWTIGYTPEIVVGVWAGNTNYEAMRDITGLTGAAPIWHQFLREALSGTPASPFIRPDGLEQAQICALSGLLPGEDCPYTRFEWFIHGTAPRQIDQVYRRILVDATTHQLADESTPSERIAEVLVLDLPPAARSWAHAEGITLLSDFAPPSLATNATGLAITNPKDNTIYRVTASLPAESQRIHIQVSGATALREVSLWLDGQVLATLDGPPYELWWPLSAGEHRLWATAKNETTQALITSPTITFEVLGSP
ncbi:MAG: penicillin-binding protein 1C [Chloroflexota bacterium]